MYNVIFKTRTRFKMIFSKQQICLYVFGIICLGTTLSMCGYWCYKFYLNEDSTVVSYRRFYDTDDDIFPTISFCLQNPFLEASLAKHGVNKSSYLQFLQGKYYSEEMLDISYDNVTVDISNFIKGYRIHFRNGTFSKFQSGLTHEKKKMLASTSFNGITGYYERFYKCFALEIPKIKDLQKFRILFSNEIFPGGKRPTTYGLKTYVHLPKQFLLSSYTARWTWPSRSSNESYKMRFLLQGIDVVTKRRKKDDTCNEFWKTYDDWIIQQHKKKIKCNNPYQVNEKNLPPCNGQELMSGALLSPFIVDRYKYEKPCKTMETVRIKFIESAMHDKKGEFWFSIQFPQNRFKQIIQTRYSNMITIN